MRRSVIIQGHIPDLFRYVTFYINYGLVVFQFALSLQVDLPREPKYRESGEKEPLLAEHRKHVYNGHIPVDSGGNGKEWVRSEENELKLLREVSIKRGNIFSVLNIYVLLNYLNQFEFYNGKSCTFASFGMTITTSRSFSIIFCS